MPHPFDAGYALQPFRGLAENYPEADVYPPGQFRVEWGPIFHRGRLDGSARVLVIGQDPAQHETIVRRILVGEAGRRLQGLLAKLGVTQSYVLVNTFLYSVYGSVKAATRRDPRLIGYRNQWLDALLVGTGVEAVISLGTAANEAWQFWKSTPNGIASSVVQAAVTHPTEPESSSKGDKAKLAAATTKLLQNWNAGLQILAPAIAHPDEVRPLVPYGTAWADGDRLPILEMDYPAGLPAWIREQDGWAQRVGKDDLAKRRNITINVTKGVVVLRPARTWFPLTGPVPSGREGDGRREEAGPHRSPHGTETGAGGTRSNDGRCVHGIARRDRVHRSGLHRRGAGSHADRSGGFRGRAGGGDGRDDFPGADRAAQPPELQRIASLVARAEALPAPRPVVRSQGLPADDQRPDDGDRRASRLVRPVVAARCPGEIRRVQMPAGRRHHHARA